MTYRKAFGRFRKRYFSALLERTGGNVSQAAKFARLNRSSLYAHVRAMSDRKD